MKLRYAIASAPKEGEKSSIDKIIAEKNDKLTLSSLLSIMDGTIDFTGIIIATTNRIKEIPKEFLRPGRFDIVIEFKNVARKELEEMITYFYPDMTNNQKKKMHRIPEYKYSAAYITQIYSSNQDNIDQFFDCLIEKD